MTEASKPPVDRLVRTLQALGTIVVGFAALASLWFGDRYPWVNAATVLVTGVVGMLVGKPLPAVTRAAFASMPPAKQTELAGNALASMPPEKRQEAIQQIVFLSSSRPPPIAPETIVPEPPPLPPVPPVP